VSGPFVTAEEYYEWIGQSKPSDLARTQALLGAASAEIRGFTDQTLSEVVGDVVVMSPIERDTLLLPERPVTAITQILVSGVAYTDYRFTREGILKTGATATTTEGTNWNSGATVTYNHGYAETTDTFALIRMICLEMVDRALRSPEAPSSFEPSEETIGWRTRLFLDEQQKMHLMNLGSVLVA
jgi:hypothetical protein